MKQAWLLAGCLTLLAYGLRAEIVSGTVVSVHDGDSLTLLTTDKRRIKIRLYGIDAPELKQPFGPEAKEALAALVLHQDVVTDIKKRDRYGRSVAAVTVGSINVNERQVATGMSWWYQAYARNDIRLRTQNDLARRTKIGLWSQANAVPPWTFRKLSRRHRLKISENDDLVETPPAKGL